MMASYLALALSLACAGTPARSSPRASTAAEEAAPPSEMTDAQLRERIQTYLGTIDTPVSAERWRALGARAVPILAGIARDSGAFPTRRAKALSALSIVGGTTAQQTILDLAKSEDTPFAVRARAIEGAGRLLPAKDLSRELKPILEGAKKVPVRAVAAETLARHAPQSACGAVRAQVAREAAGRRATFSKALERCGETAP